MYKRIVHATPSRTYVRRQSQAPPQVAIIAVVRRSVRVCCRQSQLALIAGSPSHKEQTKGHDSPTRLRCTSTRHEGAVSRIRISRDSNTQKLGHVDVRVRISIRFRSRSRGKPAKLVLGPVCPYGLAESSCQRASVRCCC